MEYSRTKLIIRYVPQKLAEEDIASIFKGCGNIKSCNIARHRTSKISLGFGFIEFYSEESASKGLQLNGLKLCDKFIHVDYARRPDPAMQDSKVYVANLPENYTISELDSLFSSYGEVIHSNILSNKRVGFVRFAYGHQADEAIKSLHHHTLPHQKVPLVVEKSRLKVPSIQYRGDMGASEVQLPPFYYLIKMLIAMYQIERPQKMA